MNDRVRSRIGWNAHHGQLLADLLVDLDVDLLVKMVLDCRALRHRGRVRVATQSSQGSQCGGGRYVVAVRCAGRCGRDCTIAQRVTGGAGGLSMADLRYRQLMCGRL